MTHIRKSLALLLALVMIFSSMSVAASAWDPKVDDGFAVNFDVRFFRKDSTGSWIETERAKPGEKVKMRVYLTTDYMTHSSNILTMFDSDLLVPTFAGGVSRTGIHPDDNFYYNFARQYDYRWETEEANFDTAGAWIGLLPEDFFAGKDLINSQIIAYNADILTSSANDDWALEYPMQVIDGTAANTVNYVGEAVVPEELMASLEKNKMPISVPKSQNASDKGTGMWLWNADVTTEIGTLTTTSNFILDANGGSFEGKATSAAPGIIGKQLEGFGTDKPTMLGYVFEGYTDVPVDKDHKITDAVATKLGLDASAVGNYLTEEQFNELLILPEDYAGYTYDYEDQTVYAAWTESEVSDVNYTFEIYKLKVNGDASNADDYELVSSIPVASKPGAQVSQFAIPFEGFTLNESLGDGTKTIIIKDDSSKLKQYYARNEYTVIYHYEDASGQHQAEKYTEIQYGATVPACSANPVKPGYRLVGWSLNSDNTMKAVPEIMPANNLDIYAVVEEDPYYYVFVAESDEGVDGTFSDGEIIKSYKVDFGTEFLEKVPAPEATGYSFTGWDKDIPAYVTGGMTFKATYQKNVYEVTFTDANNPSLNETIYKYYGETVTADEIPEGYTTTGWSADGGVTLVNFPYTVTDDVDFTATESAGYVDAIFMADGKEFTRIPVKIGEVIPAPADKPTKYGYDFIDWHPNVGGEDGAVMDTDGASFDAIFEPKTVTITFDTADGTAIPAITQKYDTPVTAPETIPEREGYEFLKWDVQVPSTMPGEDMTITAIWTKKTYKIEYKDTDGSLIASENYKFEEAIDVIDNPTKTGYTFDGWDIEIPETMPAKDIVATAKWKANSYTITFTSEEGTEPAEIPSITADYGSEITAPTVTLKNNTFKGWALADDATKTIITFPKTMPAENMNLVAVWETDKVDVVFNATGGTFSNGSSTLVAEDVPVGSTVAPTEEPTRPGFIFAGWNPSDMLVGAGQNVFEATWTPDPNYNLSYTINIVAVNPATGEEIPYTSVTGTANNGQTVEVIAAGDDSDADIVYTFEELAPSKNHVVNEDKTTVTTIEVKTGEENEITVYYVPAQLTVNFNANGGKFADGSDKVTLTGSYGDAVNSPADPTRTGYTFAGWDNTVLPTFASNADYTATWEKATFNAIFNVKNEDGEIIDTITVPYEYGAEVTAPTYDKVGDGQTFSGWVVPEGTTMGAGDMTFNATLENIEYTVSYVYTGLIPADAVVPAPQKAILGGKVTVATPADVDGYTFNGWKTADGETYAPGSELEIAETANVILYGSWEEIPVEPTYKELTYVYDGEVPANAPELPAAADVEVGTTVKVADVPSVDGYTFAGWYKDGVLTESFVMPNEEVELKGVWTKIPVPGEYKITYIYTGKVPTDAAALPAESSAATGTTVVTAEIPAAVDGYTFTGWYVNGKLTESFVMGEADVVIEGKWTKNDEYSVSYKYVGNDVNLEIPANAPAVPVDSNGYLAGETVTAADVPELDGYKFHGWYYNGVRYDGELASQFTMPNHDVVMIGMWTKDVPGAYDVSYSYIGEAPEGAAALLPAIEKVAIGETVTIADVPQLDGYTFDGWYYNGEIETSFVMPEHDVTITGIWNKIPAEKYEVTYAYEGEVPANAPAAPVDSNEYEENATVTVKTLPALEGYEFDGWYYNGTKYAAGETITMPAADITLTGEWKEIIPETYNVTYVYTGTVPANAPAVPVDANEYEEGDTVAVAAVPELDGYTFSGWYYNGVKYDGTANNSFEMPAHDAVITGEWIENAPDSYIVTYTYTGEVPENAPELPAIATAEEGSEVTVASVPSMDGYTFDGWYYNGVKYDGETNTKFTMPSENVTLEGSWTAIEYDLIIDANGGQFADGSQQYTDSLAAGEAINAPADPTKEGYVLDGWVDNNGNTYEKLPEKMPAGDTTFTAVWVEAEKPTHTITYYLVDGGEVYAIGTYAEGEIMNHPVVGEVGGIIYEGWVDKNGNPIQSVMGTTDLVAYAVVKDVKSYKATFLVDGEVYKEEMIKVGEGMYTYVPADPTKEGYIFSGWYPTVPEYMPAEDLTFNATFVKEPVSIYEYTARYVVDDKTYALYVLEEGDVIPVPEAPKKFGFKFVGWEPEVPATMPGEDVEFVAQWEIDKTLVTVVIGGTVIAGGVIAGIAGANAAWITGVSIVGGVLVIIGTAALIKHTHTVTYIVDGEVYKTYKVIEGTKIPVPADPVKEGAEFKGWEPEVPERMGNTDLVFEATWGDVAADNVDDDATTDENIDVEIPATGSAAGIAAFAVISGAAAAAYVLTRKKKEN